MHLGWKKTTPPTEARATRAKKTRLKISLAGGEAGPVSTVGAQDRVPGTSQPPTPGQFLNKHQNYSGSEARRTVRWLTAKLFA